MKRNIKWDREEIILLLDLYLRIRNEKFDKNHPEIEKLIYLLNKRAKKLGLKTTDTYRNNTGIFMKLMNLRALDSDYQGEGLKNYSKLDKEMWNMYKDNNSQLNSDCINITVKYMHF